VNRRVIFWILRLALAGLYLFAAIPKIMDPWSFARAIYNFRLLPTPAIPALAAWLPMFEAVAAAAVATGILYRGGLIALSGLSAAFAVGILSAIVRGLDIDCGCFGAAAGSPADLSHLALNAATLACGIILLVAHGRRRRRLPRKT
jgi:putative oxidoreductase